MFGAFRGREREARTSASATFLILAALAFSLAGCGGGASGTDASSANDGNSNNVSDKERAAGNPEMLDALEQLVIVAGDTNESTTRLVNNEQKRADKWLKLLGDVEVSGRNYIEAAREDAETWTMDKDPLCEDAVEWTPPMGYQLLPPYKYPFSLRAEIGDDVPGIERKDVADAREHVSEMEKRIEEFPNDPLVDESETAKAYAKEEIERAEEELDRAEMIVRDIREQEETVTILYAGWDKEHEDLYEGAMC